MTHHGSFFIYEYLLMQRKCNEKKYVAKLNKSLYSKDMKTIEKESRTLEFKKEKTNTYLKTVCAFANYCDGEIRFGVGDDGVIFPITNQSSFALDIENQINDCIRPQPDYSLTINANGTISLFVRKGFNTPYLYNNKSFKRNDTATIEVDTTELKRLILEGNNIDFDEVTYKNDIVLTFTNLENKLKEITKISSFDDNTLRSLGLLNSSGYNNAAALLADKNDFPGLEIAVFLDEDTFKERIDLSNLSLLTQFDESLKVFERNYILEKVDGKLRNKIERIPLVAFREIIANSIVHRAYDIKANTKVSMYPNRIEISSPGGLVYGINKEQYLNGAFSILRNPIIANVFKRLNIIEAFATGIRRVNKLYQPYMVKPDFDVTDYSIDVVLPTIDSDPKLSKKENEFIKLLSPNIKYTRAELERISGYGKDKVIRVLNELLDEGLVAKEGTGKSTLYFIK